MDAPDDRGRIEAWLRDDLPRIAATWLPAQRWFGGKSRPIGAVRVEDVAWLSGARGPALVLIDVGYLDAAPGRESSRDCYAALVAFVGDPRGQPLIGTLPGEPTLHAIEGTADPQAVSALLHGLVTRQPVQTELGGQILYADAAESVSRLLAGGAGAPAVRPIGAEQSNTSVRIGSTHVFKLFRRLEEGEHPQLEIGRFLVRAGYRSAPPLEGSLVFRSRTGRLHALGAFEGWIANQGDGWTHATAQLRRAARRALADDGICQDMQTLGETTAAFHLALASDASAPAFAPERVTLADCREWQARLIDQADRTGELVERQHRRWAARDAAAGHALLNALRSTRERLRTADSSLTGGFHKIRIHGDFHLGQTLKTDDGFAIIDFEGEPAKPLSDRRRKQCALKDVAGMLRSLDYARATVGAANPAGDGAEGHVDLGLRAAFLDGYQSSALAGSAAFLPSAPDVEKWTAVFELEKALYEVEYETNNRPEWVGIPLRAAVRLLENWHGA